MIDKKKTGGDAPGKDEIVMGIAWFRREEWPRLLEVSADRDQLEETYDEWLGSARDMLLRLKADGQRVEKVDVGVEELLEWCRVQQVPVDASARAALASARLRKRHGNA